MKNRDKGISRRRFLGQASCAAIGTTSIFSTLLNLRMAGAAAAATATNPNDYRALVCLFLAGGNDSFNLLVPRGASEYAEYQTIRADLALSQASLLPITPGTAIGKDLGLHPSTGGLQSLFGAGDLAFVSNVGTLVEPVTKTQYENGSVSLPRGLYSHSDQIQQWQTSVPQSSGTIGWGGRAADLLYSLNDASNISMNISLSGSNVWQAGNDVAEYSITDEGSIGLDRTEGFWGFNNIRGAAVDSQLNLEYRNLFTKTFAKAGKDAVAAHEQFTAAIDSVPALTTVFPTSNYVGDNLHMIARTIAARQALGVRRQTFFVLVGGWDHHDEVLNTQAPMLGMISDAVAAFYAALEELQVENEVTLFTASDFGRTLTSNGEGSDHAWGGNQFVVGGAVTGQEVYGTYPDLYQDNPLDTGRGRLIPTTSCDEYFAELACWFGVQPGDLATVLPNIGNFYDHTSGTPPMGFLL